MEGHRTGCHFAPVFCTEIGASIQRLRFGALFTIDAQTVGGHQAATGTPCWVETGMVMKQHTSSGPSSCVGLAISPDSPDGSACRLLGAPNLDAASAAYTSR